MNSKRTTTNNYQQPNLKTQKQKLSKQLVQEQNDRNGSRRGLSVGGGRRGREGEKVQGIRSINSR